MNPVAYSENPRSIVKASAQIPSKQAAIALSLINPKPLALATISLLALTACSPSQEAAKPGASQNPAPQSFDKPIIAQADLAIAGKPGPQGALDAQKLPLATVPVKGLLQSTRPDDRAQKASASFGRDPFSALPPTGISLPSLAAGSKTNNRPPVPVLPKSAASSSKAGAQRKPATAPQMPRIQSPNRALPPTRRSNNPLPTVPVQNNMPIVAPPPLASIPGSAPSGVPAVSPTALAEQVEVTGVVQVGMRSMAIIQAPGEGSSRHVSVGDTLSAGRVTVREIRVSPSGQPSVILEQNGQTIVKAIGASRMASGRTLN